MLRPVVQYRLPKMPYSFMDRPSRAHRILALVARNENCNNNNKSQTKNVASCGARKPTKRKTQHDKDIPDYVTMYDRGQWESLDKILMTPITLPKKAKKEDDILFELKMPESKKYIKTPTMTEEGIPLFEEYKQETLPEESRVDYMENIVNCESGVYREEKESELFVVEHNEDSFERHFEALRLKNIGNGEEEGNYCEVDQLVNNKGLVQEEKKHNEKEEEEACHENGEFNDNHASEDCADCEIEERCSENKSSQDVQVGCYEKKDEAVLVCNENGMFKDNSYSKDCADCEIEERCSENKSSQDVQVGCYEKKDEAVLVCNENGMFKDNSYSKDCADCEIEERCLENKSSQDVHVGCNEKDEAVLVCNENGMYKDNSYSEDGADGEIEERCSENKSSQDVQVICNEKKDEAVLVCNENWMYKDNSYSEDCADCEIEERCSENKSNQDQIGGNEKNKGSDEEEEYIEIASVAKHPSGKRRRTKLHCCKFCQKLIVGIGRHIVTVHKEELEVAHILALNKENRKIYLEQIEREGDYNHNKEVLATGKGELILVRRPTENELLSHTYEDYGPCTGCLGFMLKSHLWHHVKYGCKATLKATETPFSIRLGSEALLAAGLRETYSQEFEKHCIGKLVKDVIGKACINEETILRYGDYVFQKNLTVDPNQRGNNVRSAMRVLASLQLKLQEKLPSVSCFNDIFDPTHFNVIVSTVRSMCDYDNISNKSDLVSPSKAVRLGIELIKVAEFIHGEHIMSGNSTKEKLIKKFIFLVKTQWNTRISCTARSTLEQRKFNKSEVLPLTRDLVQLNKHVHDECKQSKLKLEKEINPTAYRNLSEALLTRIVLFNKRRSGESSKMKIKEYLERGAWTKETTEELKTTLSKTEQKLAENLTLVYTKGKRRSKVPVLLTAEMKELLELLIRVRNMHGIEKDNPYVFARPYPSETPLRGHDCLRKMCEKAGLLAIETVTGTKLRKYVATVSQIFNLSENETDWLAKHMGHDIRIHRQFYRLHEAALELTKVSRILLAIDKGKANKFAGKTLDEIDIDDMSDLEEEVEEEGSTSAFQGPNKERLEKNEDDDLDPTEVSQQINSSNSFEKDENYIPEEYSEYDIEETRKSKKIRSGRSVIKKPWSLEEKTAVLQFFRDTIAKKKGVKKQQADKCIEMHSVLQGRTWLNVRDFIRNHIRKLC